MDNNTNGEEGSALIIVLTTLSVLAVMIAQLTASSEIASREARTAATRSALRYSAESATERGFWLLLNDRRRHPSRRLRVIQPPEMIEEERWQADGATRELAYEDHKVEITLLDANRGIDISNSDAGTNLRRFLLRDTEDLEQVQTVRHFIDVLLDYIDDRERVTSRQHGKSQADYEAEGWPDMPRGDTLQMREELLWIDGLKDIMPILQEEVSATNFIETIRLIPPAGRSFPGNDKPSLFSSHPLLIKQIAGLSQLEFEQVNQARREWQEGKGDFFNYLEPELASRLEQHFTFKESAVVTIVAKATSSNNLTVRKFRVTRDISRLNRNRGSMRVVENWQKAIY